MRIDIWSTPPIPVLVLNQGEFSHTDEHFLNSRFKVLIRL